MAKRAYWERPLDIFKLIVAFLLLTSLAVLALRPAPRVIITTPPAITITPPPATPVVVTTPTPAATPGATPAITPAITLVVTPIITPTAVSVPAPIITRPANGARLSADELCTIEGTSQPGLGVYIYDGQTLLGEAMADTEGRWRLEMPAPLTEGEHLLRAVVKDAMAREVAASEPVVFRAIRAAVRPLIWPPRGGVVMIGGTVEGAAEPYARLLIYDDQSVLGETVAGPDGRWRFRLPAYLRTGRHMLRAVAVDDMGRALAASEPVQVQVLEFRLPVTGTDCPPTGRR